MSEITELGFLVFDVVDENGNVRPDALFLENGVGVMVLPFMARTSSDTGAGYDVAVLVASYELDESGAGVESSDLTWSFFGQDQGVGTEQSYVHTIVTDRFSSDSAEGSEAALVAFAVQSQEVGSGVDSLYERALEVTQGWVVQESAEPLAEYARSETAQGEEVSRLSQAKGESELGDGVEKAIVRGDMIASEQASGEETTSVLVEIVSADAGAGVERIVDRDMVVQDSALGEEEVNLIGAVGRDMVVTLYTMGFHQACMYGRTYHKSTIYTAEAGAEK